MKTHFAFWNAHLLCGQCGHAMAPDVKKSYAQENWTPVVYCLNRECPHYEVRYLVSTEARVKLEKL